ncbi:hypothetical protein F511_26984 [Dorcoceras hygrometricum]|uniref:Uncharacterized protein n=1 Tax=Dorcoceras hygrometricum TaxID=472368 RepID=A0A2Z7AB77_9LAMI|nr:hypothetical protein F511_26984 [Dorcoceras hygrometricum]
MKKSAGALSVDDISSDVIIQQEGSADGLALMTSSVMSSQSTDGLRDQSQESAGTSLKRNQQVATVLPVVSYNEPAVAIYPVVSYSGSRRKQQQHPVESLYESAVSMNTVASFAYPVAIYTHPVASFGIQTQEKKKQAKCRNSTSRGKSRRKITSRSDGSAVKQLTIYESWMSTAELNSNGESDKTQSTLKMERING